MNEWRESGQSLCCPPLCDGSEEGLLQTRCCLSGPSASPGHGPGHRTAPGLCLLSPPPAQPSRKLSLWGGGSSGPGWARADSDWLWFSSRWPPEPSETTESEQPPPAQSVRALCIKADTQGNVSSCLHCQACSRFLNNIELIYYNYWSFIILIVFYYKFCVQSSLSLITQA